MIIVIAYYYGVAPSPRRSPGRSITTWRAASPQPPRRNWRPLVIARGGIVLLSSSTLFPLGVALLVIGQMLEAGATGAVKAIKVSAKLLAGRSPDTPSDRAPSGVGGAGLSAAPDSRAG